MIDYKIFSEVIERLGKLAADWRATRSKEQREATEAFADALLKTKMYLAAHQTDESSNELSEAWKKAALAVQPIDRGYAELCMYKATYWASPTQWNPDEVFRAQTNIDAIERVLMQLLKR